MQLRVALLFVILLIKGIYLCYHSASRLRLLPAVDARSCSTGSSRVLLAFRLLSFLYGAILGLLQLYRRGPSLFNYFSYWNWCLLTFYFGLASFLSLSALPWRGPGSSSGTAGAARAGPAEKLLVVMYNMLVPLSWVTNVRVWMMFMPRSMEGLNRAEKRYMNAAQTLAALSVHGLNGVLALLELCLNELPALFALSGFMDLWLCAYVVFNLMHYVRFGRFIYTLLDLSLPSAWAKCAWMFAIAQANFLLFLGVDWLKQHDGVASVDASVVKKKSTV